MSSRQPFRDIPEYLAFLRSEIERLSRLVSAQAVVAVSGASGGTEGVTNPFTEDMEFWADVKVAAAAAPVMDDQEILDCIYKITTSDLASDASAGQKDVIVDDATGWAVGNSVYLADDNHNEYNTIASIAGNTLTMENNLSYTYTTAANGYAYSFNPDAFPSTEVFCMSDRTTGNYANEFLIISSSTNAPLKVFDQGVVIKKDVGVGGFVSSNQGGLFLGHGLYSRFDPPHIRCLHSADGYNIIHVDGMDGNPASLDLQDVYVHGSLKDGSGNPLVFSDADDLFTTSGAVTQYYIASIVGDDTVAMGTRANATGQIGVFQESKSTGQTVTVRKRGRSYVVAGENLSAGDRVTTDDSGQAIKMSGHTHDIDSHTHAAGSLDIGDHTHEAGGVGYEQTTEATMGDHIHASGGVGVEGTDSANTPNHVHESGGSGVEETDSVSLGSHVHESGGTGVEETTTVSNHDHYVNGVGMNTAGAGTHNHAVGGTTAGIYGTPPTHSHAVGGTTAGIYGSPGSHSHSVGGTTAGIYGTAPTHSHWVGGVTGGVYSGGGVSGSTAGSGTLTSHLFASGDFLGKVLVGATTGNLAEVDVQLGA